MSPAAEHRSLTQAFLLIVGATALTLALLVATSSLGVAGFLLVALIAVPAAYIHMRYGTTPAAATVVLSAFGAYLLDGSTGSVGYVLQFGLVSIILPLLLRRGWSWDWAAALSVTAIVLVSFLILALYAALAGSSVSGQIDAFTDAQVTQAMALYEASDLTPEQLEEVKSAAERMAGYLRYAYFGAAVAVTGLLTMLLLGILSYSARGNYSLPLSDFREWKAHELLVWPLIAAGFVSFFADGFTKQVGVNLLIIMLPIYFLQGLAIVAHFFDRRNISPIMRGCGYVLIAFLNPLPIVITGIGVFDLWVDFRKPRVKTT